MTDNNLQKKVAELEAQIRKLKKSNLGLVFEDKPEDVVEQCQNQVPVLKEVVKNRINLSNGFTNNLLIEGDNYHSLSVLNYTHKGKIDLIYIDPPYNTGNHDFIYNDQYVDTEDSYRHSKWLSFMRNRLILTRELLKDDGAIFISIDDNEQAHLRILCDKIFGERNFVANIIWQHSVQPKGYTGTFSLHHNHILCYRKSEKFGLNTLERTDVHNKNYSNPDNDPRGPWRSGDVRNALYRPNLIFDIKTPSGKTIKPPQNGWRWSKETIKEKIKTGEIIFSEDETRIIRKIYLDTLEGRTPETIWFGKDVGTTREAQQELKNLFKGEIKFETPKPTKLIKQLLKLHKGDSVVVLDFFAGSGTTGHAVLNLNTEDGGNRKFILCTNNEDNNGSGKKIATDICYPRIKKVIKGYNDLEGIPSNLFYYQTDLVDIEQIHKVPDEAKIRITYQAGEMIAVREDALNELEKNDWWQIFEGKGKLVAIYFKEDKAKLAELIAKLEKKNQPTALYIFSWGKNEYKGEYSTANIRVEDIPEPIIEVYKELNRI